MSSILNLFQLPREIRELCEQRAQFFTALEAGERGVVCGGEGTRSGIGVDGFSWEGGFNLWFWRIGWMVDFMLFEAGDGAAIDNQSVSYYLTHRNYF